MFQLTELEYKNLRFQFETSSFENYGGRRYLPYAFTEQGVAMLATVLRTKVAEQVSVMIMDAFVAMRHYLANANPNDKALIHINNKLIEHDERLNYLFSKFDKKEQLFLPGTTYDAYSSLTDIITDAKNELIIIDTYADKNLLDLIKETPFHIITIITSNKSKLSPTIITKFNSQYNNKLKVIIDNTFHDRYIILDQKEVYHIGTSLNHIGKKVFSINKLEDKIVKNELLNYIASKLALSP